MVSEKNYTLVEQIERKILRHIIDNSYGVDTQLPKEQELADLFEVSRVVVREALSRIRALGVIETKRKKGTVIVMPKVFGVLKLIVESGILNKETLKELYELRLMLEIGMADFIFKNITESDIKKIESIVKKEEETINTEESIALDVKFHATLYAITGNKSLQDFQNLLEPLFKYYSPRSKDYRQNQIVSHRGLLRILNSGNAESFRMAMRMHLDKQYEDMEKILDAM